MNSLAYYRLTISMLALVFLSLFYYENLKNIGPGSGYIFLAGFVALVFLLKGFSANYLKMKKNILIVFLFLAYVSFRYLIDRQDYSGFFEFTMGSTRGLFFSFGLGVLLAYLFSFIYDVLTCTPRALKFFRKLIIVYYIITLSLIVGLLLSYTSIIVGDNFLISDVAADYQRPGMLIFFFNIQNAILFAILKSFSLNNKNYLGLLFYVSCALSSILAQLIGSNFGFVSGFIIIIMMATYSDIISTYKNYELPSIVSVRSVISGWIGLQVLKTIAKYLILFFLTMFVLIDMSIIDVTKIRLISSEGEINSLISRMEIIQESFLSQFSYAPIIGHMDVHTIFGEPYVHSLLALFTHLGVTGVLFFSIMIFYIYKDIKKYSLFNNYVNFDYQILRFLMMTHILIIALVMGFFTWMPLWYIIGLFATSFISKYPLIGQSST